MKTFYMLLIIVGTLTSIKMMNLSKKQNVNNHEADVIFSKVYLDNEKARKKLKIRSF